MITKILLLSFCFVTSFFTSTALAQQTGTEKSQPQSAALISHNELTNGGTLGMSYWYPIHLNEYFEEVRKSISSAGPSASCQSKYQKVLDKGTLDIHYALGYFDDSTGIEQIWSGINFGKAPSWDVDIFHVIRQKLLSPCADSVTLTCGFLEKSFSTGQAHLTKEITLYGRSILVRFQLVRGSLTPNFIVNTQQRKTEQIANSLRAERFYFEESQSADVIFYNGHSRNGGGPDFNPPVQRADGHVNYPHYLAKRIGINRVLKLLTARKNDPPILFGLFSCYSRKHFYERLTKASPKMGLVLTGDEVDYRDNLHASMGFLEGVLQGECGAGMSQVAQRTPQIRESFKAFRF